MFELLKDTQFQFLYLFKVIRYFFAFASLYLAEKIFEELYIRRVFVENKDPPNILAFIGIFIGLEVGFHLMIFLILVLVKHLFKRESNNFVIDNEFLGKLLIDYIVSLIVIFIFTAIIAGIVQKKKYFRYNLEGMRAIRALKEIALSIIAVLILIPYFQLLG